MLIAIYWDSIELTLAASLAASLAANCAIGYVDAIGE